MNPVVVASILVGLVALATGLGLAWRATTGRVARGNHQVVSLKDVPVRGRATLLQFSTDVCAPCVPTRSLLRSLADEHDGVAHVDVNLTQRPDLATQFNIMQTPTTLILDSMGIIRARIGGAPRRDDVRAELSRILAA
jgi:thiol-disulfide isomerase/thioredoxin